MVLFWIIAGSYIAIAILVAVLAGIAGDPYGRAPVWRDRLEAVLIGVFWFPLLVYTVFAVLYFWIWDLVIGD